MAHVADRACIGHCFSYANYEAPTVPNPATRGNRVNAPSVAVSQAIERGEHVAALEAPVTRYAVRDGENGSLCLRTLHASESVHRNTSDFVPAVGLSYREARCYSKCFGCGTVCRLRGMRMTPSSASVSQSSSKVGSAAKSVN